MKTLGVTPKQTEKQEASNYLKRVIKPGDTVFTILRHVSRSGMMRHISTVIKTENGIQDITWHVAKLLDDKRADDGGIKMGGCGMDMGFSLVYSLGSVLFRNEFSCVGEGCPANDHSNAPYPERVAGSMQHSDAGYALRQAWL